MDLKCYLYDGWEPRIRPASPKRDWMDHAGESFPYRCLPLGIANSHGWEVLSPCSFEVEWNGGPLAEDVSIRVFGDVKPEDHPVALFGLGTFTFHIQGLIRTPAGWNIWVSGPPNFPKDGAVPLTGIIETDWSPYSFTMNWKLTRPNHIVRFEANEPMAHFFPIQRNIIENITPTFLSIEDDKDLKDQFQMWSASRDAFQKKVRENPPERPADKWQKLYYRGLRPDGVCPISDHKSKMHVHEFARHDMISVPGKSLKKQIKTGTDVSLTAQSTVNKDWQSEKQLWVLKALKNQRRLLPETQGIYKVEGISAEDFLRDHYATNCPVVLSSVAVDWTATKNWSPEYLRDKVGIANVIYQGDRDADADFETRKDDHLRQAPFSDFLDSIASGSGNNAYLTAYNSGPNVAALSPLMEDLGRLDELLIHEPDRLEAMLWIGPEGTFTPLHHDLTNNLLVQLRGRKRVIMASPLDTPNLYNSLHVFSDIKDVTKAKFTDFPALESVNFIDFTLEAGDALFIPIGWWHQVTSLDFSVSATYTNFRWPNIGWETHPA
jgi:hypothetical protein